MTKPVAAVIAERVKDARSTRKWTVRQLAERCAPLISGLTSASVTNIERARREVSAQELLVLALVLGVHPALLLIPRDPTEAVEIAPGAEVTAEQLVLWLTAAKSTAPDGELIASSGAMIDALRQEAERKIASRLTLSEAASAAGFPGHDVTDPEYRHWVVRYMQDVLSEFARMPDDVGNPARVLDVKGPGTDG